MKKKARKKTAKKSSRKKTSKKKKKAAKRTARSSAMPSSVKADSKTTAIDFGYAFKYPFRRAKGLWNGLWLLLPIIGWFALYGYTVRIVQNFVKGDFKELPVLSFGSDLGKGFWMFLKMIPFMALIMIINFGIETTMPENAGIAVSILLSLIIVPILTINFLVKETVAAYFEFGKLNAVFKNFGEYLLAVVKSFVMGMIFAIMALILVGIPAHMFTKNIFFADFYRRFC